MKFAQIKDLSHKNNEGDLHGYYSFEFCKILSDRDYEKDVRFDEYRFHYTVYTEELEFIQEIELWDFLYYLI